MAEALDAVRALIADCDAALSGNPPAWAPDGALDWQRLRDCLERLKPAPRVTKAQHRALVWLSQNEPVGQFPIRGNCTLAMLRKLEALGLAARNGKEPGVMGFARYGLTPAGRAALNGGGE